VYARTYPWLFSLLQISKNKQIAIFVSNNTVVYADGALTTLYQESRTRIKPPPFDVTTLTNAERNAKLEKRKLKSKIEEEVDNDKFLPHDHREKKTLTQLSCTNK
jgi:hypothetical protein